MIEPSVKVRQHMSDSQEITMAIEVQALMMGRAMEADLTRAIRPQESLPGIVFFQELMARRLEDEKVGLHTVDLGVVRIHDFELGRRRESVLQHEDLIVLVLVVEER